MFKKTIITGVLTLLILVIPVQTFADQYYDQYPGSGFLPDEETQSYFISGNGSIYHDDTTNGDYNCPVNFNVPDGSTYFIKSIGMRFKDNRTDGLISVELTRKNLYTGNFHTVASWHSGFVEASSIVLTASKGTEPGVKLIDAKKFAYWLNVYFYIDGDINPSNDLILHQVRIHYGT